MKKVLLSIIFISAFLSAHAQFDGDINFYTNGGLSASWLGIDHGSASTITPKHPILSFAIGTFADLKMPKSTHWSFNPGIYIVGNGGDFTNDDGNVEQLRLFSVQPSLNFVYNTRMKNGTFYIGGGPSPSLAFAGETRIHVPGEKTKKADLHPLRKGGDYHELNFGAEAVVGYKTKSGFLFNITYDHGLTNLITGSSINPAGDKEIRPRSIYFTIGHVFFNQ